MRVFDWIELFFFVAILLVLVPVLGSHIAAVFSGAKNLFSPVFAKVEERIYRLCGIDSQKEMNWKQYASAALGFTLLNMMFLFLLQISQNFFPLNPQNFPAVPWHLALNTAVSFATNTNWQAYSGETTLSYFTQMVGLCVQNFISAAIGFSAFFALVRGVHRKTAQTIGNFWVDFTRGVLYLLLPLAFFLAIILVSQGVVQTFSPYIEAITLEQVSQTIPLGPAASQVAIKQLGTNGGGFFGANSAHPFENPTALTNFFETLAIVLIPASSAYAYGLMIGSKKEGWLIFSVMFVIWIMGFLVALFMEGGQDPVFGVPPFWEGKEVRIGMLPSILWSTLTTATANGSTNAMISSLSPLSGGVALFNMMLGEIIFGGVGVGISGMILFILLTIFLTGLMSGRTPQYQYKKIGKQEMKWVVIAIIFPIAMILLGSGICSVLPVALGGLDAGGPHGLSELLYAFSSTTGNNGSAFAGLQANTPFYNVTLSIVMCLGRITILLPTLAVAGSLVQKNTLAPSPEMFRSDSFLFAALLLCTILLVGALTFFPALCLGPIVEYFIMLSGKTF